jgi:hypothetical protein
MPKPHAAPRRDTLNLRIKPEERAWPAGTWCPRMRFEAQNGK